MARGSKKEKKEKDPNAPKRPMTAFFFFSQEKRAGVKKVHPDWKVGDIAKELGRQWEKADKSKYESEAQKDKARYEREMTAYKGGAAKKGKK